MEEDFVVTEVVVVVLNSPRSEANEDPVADKQPRLLPGCTVCINPITSALCFTHEKPLGLTLNGVVACHCFFFHISSHMLELYVFFFWLGLACVPLKISTATLVLHGTSTVKENVPFVAFAAL